MGRQERIKLTDTLLDATVKLGEGNPGAISVIMQLIKNGSIIDPDAAFGEIANLLSLDSLGIYGPRIWMLYKDVCDQNLVNTIAVLRAVQLGKLSENVMNHAIDNYGEGIYTKSILKIVQNELPKFGKNVHP